MKVSSGAIVHELLGDEVIIANLDSGSYYSLRGASVPLWQLLVAGWDGDEIISLFSEKFAQSHSMEIREFIHSLVEEGLLVEGGERREPVDLVWPSSYAPPSFEKYDEMKNLLMLDPIHEVDAAGWPKRS